MHIISCRGTDNLLRGNSQFAIRAGPSRLFQTVSLADYRHHHNYSSSQANNGHNFIACAARVTVVVLCVCLSVCLFVSDYSRTTGYEAAYERYQQLQCYKGKKNNVAILLKRLRSRDMA